MLCIVLSTHTQLCERVLNTQWRALTWHCQSAGCSKYAAQCRSLKKSGDHCVEICRTPQASALSSAEEEKAGLWGVGGGGLEASWPSARCNGHERVLVMISLGVTAWQSRGLWRHEWVIVTVTLWQLDSHTGVGDGHRWWWSLMTVTLCQGDSRTLAAWRLHWHRDCHTGSVTVTLWQRSHTMAAWQSHYGSVTVTLWQRDSHTWSPARSGRPPTSDTARSRHRSGSLLKQRVLPRY